MNEVRRQCVLAIPDRFIDFCALFLTELSLFVFIFFLFSFFIFRFFLRLLVVIVRNRHETYCKQMQRTHPRHGYEYKMISTRFVKLYRHDVEIYDGEREREWEWKKCYTCNVHSCVQKRSSLFASRCYGVWCQFIFFFAFTTLFRHLFPLTDYYLHEYMSFVNISLFLFAVFCSLCLVYTGQSNGMTFISHSDDIKP